MNATLLGGAPRVHGQVHEHRGAALREIGRSENGRASPHEEHALVRAAHAGDARAFRKIVEQHYPALYSMACRLVRDRYDAEDLVQESFVKAYLHLDRFDPRYRLSAWLGRIARNTCRDFLKSPRRRECACGGDFISEHAAPGVRADDQLVAREEWQRTEEALARLSPKNLEALVLKDLQGMSYKEITEITGDPITALKIRVARARAKFRFHLDAMALARPLSGALHPSLLSRADERTSLTVRRIRAAE